MKTSNALRGLLSGLLLLAAGTAQTHAGLLVPAGPGSELYLANQGNNTIRKFTPGGAASAFASGGLNTPRGLAFDTAGNLFVSNYSSNTITKFTPGGVGSVFASTGLSNPECLAFDSAGNLYVASRGNNRIMKFTPGGVGSIFASSGLSLPIGLAFDGAGNLYVGNIHNNDSLGLFWIQKFSPTGANLGVFANQTQGVRKPAAIAFDSAGNLFVANYAINPGVDSSILKITPAGVGSTFALNNGLHAPIGLAFDSAGNLYVSNPLINTIKKFSPTGADLGVFANSSSGLTTPVGLAFGPALDSPPTANAGADQSIRAGANVLLDGSASFDDNTASAALVYAWSFQSKPAGSTAAIVNANTATPSFIADVAGSYVVQLVVTDELGAASQPDAVIISSDNQAPTAVATVDFGIAIVGTASNFDGTGSTDPENDALTYAWTLTAAPAGSTAAILGGNTATPSLTTDLEGTYELTLNVSDFLGAGTPATVEIVATTPAGYAEIQIVAANDLLEALQAGQVTSGGNQTALETFLKSATRNLQQGDLVKAIADLKKVIERTDGFPLRGAVDLNGSGRDWVTDPAAQTEAYALLNAALAALQP